MDRQAIRDQVRLQTVIEDTNVSDAEINTIINQGVEEVAVVEDWPFLQASENISLVADTQTAAIASDWNRTLALVDDDNDETLAYVSPSEFFMTRGNDTGNTGSTPIEYTIWEGSFYLSPIPDTNDTNRLTHYYFKNPTTLSTDGTSPEWDVAFHPVLVEYTKWKLYEREEYYDRADQAEASYARYLRNMADFYNAPVERHPFIYGDGAARKSFTFNIPSLWRL